MYVDELNDAAKRLLDVAKNPDATSEDVQGALYAAKVTLGKLPDLRDFLDDLDKLDQYGYANKSRRLQAS